MKHDRFLMALCLIIPLGLMTQCEKGGRPDGKGPSGDAKPWAGGGGRTDLQNPPIGGEYGDLYIILRDDIGRPEMTMIEDEDGVENWYVQPIEFVWNDVTKEYDEITLELNSEGDVIDEVPPIEVDFGRLNIVRSPPSVLAQAFEEALKVLDPDNKETYPVTLSLDFCGRLTSYYYNEEEGAYVTKTIDSPRENMAIYKEIMNNLFTGDLAFLGEDPNNFEPLTIAASCFAAGSDKTGTVDKDEVVYINGFMDCIGLNSLPNDNDLDFDGNVNRYFNFAEPIVGGAPFFYNRNAVYGTRMLEIRTLFDDGTWESEILSVADAMDERGLFNGRWDEMGTLTPVELFAQAVDDAVQVLNFVHGDTNITYIP